MTSKSVNSTMTNDEDIDKSVVEEALRGIIEQRKEEIYQTALQLATINRTKKEKNRYFQKTGIFYSIKYRTNSNSWVFSLGPITHKGK